MLIKKTSLDRSIVLDLFSNPDQNFIIKLLKEEYFPFTSIPTCHQIDSLLELVEKQYNTRRLCWTSHQDELLNIIVFGVCVKNKTLPLDFTSLHWEQVSRMFRYHNWKACRNRWLNERHQKASWTSEEDRVLIELQKKLPNKWCDIAIELMRICQTSYVRQGKQCRDRWVNKLDPNIIQLPWNREEELRLFQEVRRRGKKWAEISLKVFKLRRTENTIKNRFYNLLKQEENRLRLGRIPKEERDILLLDSVIDSLMNQLDRKENEEFKKIRNYNVIEWSIKTIDIRELVVVKGRKIQKLNDL